MGFGVRCEDIAELQLCDLGHHLLNLVSSPVKYAY